MRAFRSILFDLGNVLVRFEPSRFFEVIGIDDDGKQRMLKPQMLDLGRMYESGALNTRDFRQKFRELFCPEHNDEILEEAFRSVLTEPIEGVEKIVQRVAARYEVGLVSNTSPIHFDLCLRTASPLKHFDRFYLSYSLGALKPDDRFYRGVIEGEGLEPGEMVFIDDLEENIAGAGRAGFVGVQFRGALDLEARLGTLGIL